MHQPFMSHWVSLKWLLCYLCSTTSFHVLLAMKLIVGCLRTRTQSGKEILKIAHRPLVILPIVVVPLYHGLQWSNVQFPVLLWRQNIGQLMLLFLKLSGSPIIFKSFSFLLLLFQEFPGTISAPLIFVRIMFSINKFHNSWSADNTCNFS